jgi:hypothetical protein
MKNELLQELNQFLGKAALATYAGGGPEVDPEEPGFKDLEFKEGKWRYKDSYTGFFQSWGREDVWHDGNPVWTQIYGGGMSNKFQKDAEFAHKTLIFSRRLCQQEKNRRSFSRAAQRVSKKGIGNMSAIGKATSPSSSETRKSNTRVR